jgi:hypothetical protein
MQKNLLRFGAVALAAVVAFITMGDVAASTLTARLVSNYSASYVAAQDLGSSSWDLGTSGSVTISLTDGSGANQANKIFQDHAATTTSYDLDGGSLANPLGGSQAAFSRIVSIRLCAASSNSASLALGGDWVLTKYLTPGGDTLANVTIPVHPGGCFLFTAPNATGVAVTASTGDGLTVTVSGSDAFDILVIGS